MRIVGKSGLLPGFQLLAGLAQHPVTDGQNQSCVFSNGDEPSGRNIAELRMLKTQQRLKAR